MNLNPTIVLPILFIVLTFVLAHIGLKPYEVTAISQKRGGSDDIAAPILTIIMLAGLYACCAWGLYQQKEWYSSAVAHYFVRIAPFIVPLAYYVRWKNIREAPKNPVPRDFTMPTHARRGDSIAYVDFGNPPTGGGSYGNAKATRKRRPAA